MLSFKPLIDWNHCLFSRRQILSEIEKEKDSWPFMAPVNTKQIPQYRKIIKQPMDFSTMKSKLKDKK